MFQKRRSAAAAVAAAALILTGLAAPTAASAASPHVQVENVRHYGARGNGTADDTAAFQTAIERSQQSGNPVYVPYGQYRITEALELTDQLVYGQPDGSWSSDSTTLPTILPTNVDASAFVLHGGGAVSGLNFSYEQDTSGTPTEYAPTIMLAGVGTRVSAVRIFQAWIGIDTMPGADVNTGRAVIEDVFISNVARMGVHLDKGWDATTLMNVEVWTPASTYNGYFLDKGTGVLLEHNDALRVNDVFVYGANVGIHMRSGDNGSGTWATLTNTSTDFSVTGIRLEGSNHVTIAGGSFWSHYYGIHIDGEDTHLTISSADLRGNAGPALLVDDVEYLTVASSNIERTHADFTEPALHLVGGRNIVIDGNYIESVQVAVKIGAVERLVLTDNIIETTRDTEPIENGAPSDASVVIDGNILE